MQYIRLRLVRLCSPQVAPAEHSILSRNSLKKRVRDDLVPVGVEMQIGPIVHPFAAGIYYFSKDRVQIDIGDILFFETWLDLFKGLETIPLFIPHLGKLRKQFFPLFIYHFYLRKCPPMRAAEPREGLFLRQIKFGGEILTSARTHFARAERVVA